MEHWKKVRIEGFQLSRLLTACLEKKIELKDIQVKSDMEMTLRIAEADFNRLRKLAKSTYKITVLEDKGYRPFIKKILSNKVAIAGLCLFTFLIYYQSLFVAEIRIDGYESFTEAQVRESLRKAGFYEGCRKEIDLSQVKLEVGDDLGNITWMSIRYNGSLAEVSLVEGTINPQPLDLSKPCHIVADKEGYIEKILPKEGIRAMEPGTYVKPGDVLISGMVPLSSTAYGTGAEAITERYVHAQGIVRAKIPYRLGYYQDRYEIKREKTGNKIVGLAVTIGDKTINTAKLQNYWFNRFEAADYSSRTLVNTVRPIPIQVEFLTIEEVTLEKRERQEEEIMKLAETQLRGLIKEKLPKNAEILNKSLNFTAEKNIIEVSAMIESLQEIGTEQEIMIGNTESETTSEGSGGQNPT